MTLVAIDPLTTVFSLAGGNVAGCLELATVVSGSLSLLASAILKGECPFS